MLSLDNIKLVFEDSALRRIAKIANENKTGARGLRNIIERLLIDIVFDYAGKGKVREIKITEEYVENKTSLKKAA